MTAEKRITKSGDIRWVVRFRCGGELYHGTYDTKAEADAFETTTKADHQRGVGVSLRGGRVTVTELGREWRSTSAAKGLAILQVSDIC